MSLPFLSGPLCAPWEMELRLCVNSSPTPQSTHGKASLMFIELSKQILNNSFGRLETGGSIQLQSWCSRDKKKMTPCQKYPRLPFLPLSLPLQKRDTCDGKIPTWHLLSQLLNYCRQGDSWVVHLYRLASGPTAQVSAPPL